MESIIYCITVTPGVQEATVHLDQVLTPQKQFLSPTAAEQDTDSQPLPAQTLYVTLMHTFY